MICAMEWIFSSVFLKSIQLLYIYYTCHYLSLFNKCKYNMKLWNSSEIHTVVLLIFFLNKTDPHWSSIVNFHSLFPIGGTVIHVNHFWASYLTHPVPVKTGLTLNSAINQCCWTGKSGHKSCVSCLWAILQAKARKVRWLAWGHTASYGINYRAQDF